MDDRYLAKFDAYDQISMLLSKYLTSGLDDEEQATLDEWLGYNDYTGWWDNFKSKEELLSNLKRLAEIKQNDEEYLQKLNIKIQSISTPAYKRPGSSKRFLLMAASILMWICLTAAWLWFRSSDREEVNVPTQFGLVGDAEPGKDGAVLTLANGNKIILDTSANGIVALQGDNKVYKKEGQLIYGTAGANKRHTSAVMLNTLSTPRGRQYSLRLSDNSVIKLNAESSIKYPIQFGANERLIELTGEAYLEVAADARKPFKVLVDGMTIEVLGTRFNVNAYKDDGSVKATLVEGMIQVVKGNNKVVLNAGNQVKATQEKLDLIDKADVDADLAWTSGLIAFKGADIKDALRQIGRWYDVDIEYKTAIKVPNVTGVIPRTLKLSEVLKIVEINTGLHFTIAQSKVIVEQRGK